MELLNVATARSLWFFPTAEFNPRGLTLLPLLTSVQERYKFQFYPTKPEDVFTSSGGINFGYGSFLTKSGEEISIVKFAIYLDGILAETNSSTEASDEFLSDLLAHLTDRFQVQFSDKMIKRKVYNSELVIRSCVDLSLLNDKFESFSKLIGEAIGADVQFEAIGVRFGTEPDSAGQHQLFSIERRVGSAFQEQRYFSSAQTTTTKHIGLLNHFEILFGS